MLPILANEMYEQILSFTFPKIKFFTEEKVQEHKKWLGVLASVNKLFCSLLLPYYKECREIYNIITTWGGDPSLHNTYKKLVIPELQERPPFLITALRSIVKKNDNSEEIIQKEEANEKIQRIIALMPGSVHCALGEDARHGVALTPWFIATKGKASPEIMDLLKNNGANTNPVYSHMYAGTPLYLNSNEEIDDELPHDHDEEKLLLQLLMLQPKEKPTGPFKHEEYRKYLLFEQVGCNEVASTLLKGIVSQHEWASMTLNCRKDYLLQQSKIRCLLTYTDFTPEALLKMDFTKREELLWNLHEIAVLAEQIPTAATQLMQEEINKRY